MFPFLELTCLVLMILLTSFAAGCPEETDHPAQSCQWDQIMSPLAVRLRTLKKQLTMETKVKQGADNMIQTYTTGSIKVQTTVSPVSGGSQGLQGLRFLSSGGLRVSPVPSSVLVQVQLGLARFQTPVCRERCPTCWLPRGQGSCQRACRGCDGRAD